MSMDLSVINQLWVLLRQKELDETHVSQIKSLLKATEEGVNSVMESGLNVLMQSAFFGHDALVSDLILEGVNVHAKDTKGLNALMWAVIGGQSMKAIQSLIQAQVDLNEQCENGLTALMHALNGFDVNEDVVRLLIEQGADVNIQTKEGETVLSLIVNRGRLDLLDLILQAGGDVNVKDHHEETPLMIAAARDDVDALKVLIEKGARLNDKNYEGWTALMLAAEEGAYHAVEFLLEVGVDVSIVSQDGVSFESLTVDDFQMRECLRKHQAQLESQQLTRVIGQVDHPRMDNDRFKMRL